MEMPLGSFDELAPETILPAQFFEAVRPGLLQRAEYRLAFAVLADGVNCFIKHSKAKSRVHVELFCETRDWLMSTSRDGLFGYESLCEMLNINAAKLRRALLDFVPVSAGALAAIRPAARRRRGRLTSARTSNEVQEELYAIREPFDSYEIPHDLDAALALTA
jgi:hypothetical protein